MLADSATLDIVLGVVHTSTLQIILVALVNWIADSDLLSLVGQWVQWIDLDVRVSHSHNFVKKHREVFLVMQCILNLLRRRIGCLF